ncbi:uncharacterized protein LOC102702483 [Oryza brachyantha]|uniref:uncharacterized protein LOC102702483 n=1 Tax=Oryza brachyantha TaxID=4533 RepID=UPI001ADA3A29|nr:uncharacterized protein LOC102702483 [Oryza brachyantha]
MAMAMTEAEKEPLTMFAVVVMAILAGAMAVVGVERLIRGRFTLFSMLRFLLRSTFLLTLPLLSSMSRGGGDGDPEKTKRILFVILWLLLIELIRKKVTGMVRSVADSGGFSRAAGRFRPMGHSDEVTRLLWIGYLIFSNTDYAAKEKGGTNTVVIAMFAVLWCLVLAKLVQRVFNEWKAQESLTTAGNTHLIACYMQHVVDEEEDKFKEPPPPRTGAGTGDAALARCKYVVMGEEKLVLLDTKQVVAARKKKKDRDGGKVVTITTRGCGYGVGRFPDHQSEQKHAHLLVDLSKSGEVITVDQISTKISVPHWCCCFTGRSFTEHLHLLCFSFSLFKLLRRRLEHYPMVEAGSRMSRRLMLDGLLAGGSKKTFQVIRQELDFVDHYYDTGSPVVMSAPWLFLVNYFFSLFFVCMYVVAVVIVILDKDLRGGGGGGVALYVAIAWLLVVTLLTIEFTELLTSYLLSNWFMVHLLCLLASDGGRLWKWLCRPAIRCFIAGRFLLFYSFKCMLRLSCRGVDVETIRLKQVSILRVCEPIHKLLSWSPLVKLPTQGGEDIVNVLKKALSDSLKSNDNDDGAGAGAVVTMPKLRGQLVLEGGSDTCTQAILACHLATELMELKHVVMVEKKTETTTKTKKLSWCERRKQKREQEPHRGVVTALSRYCMYLVARSPELLPDNERWVSDRYADMKGFLQETSRRCCCCPCRLWKCGCWRTVLMDMDADDVSDPAAKAGVKLFKKLDVEASAWKDLAGFWVKMVVYIAPSNDVEGHATALADSGGDLITYLWAICTHTGIIRKPLDKAPPELHAGGDQV